MCVSAVANRRFGDWLLRIDDTDPPQPAGRREAAR
jgi:glutamyl/glutaminyl-tRNA synthetase